MAETYDPTQDSRPPCDFPEEGEISLEDFSETGKYKDCKIEWGKESGRAEEKQLHFSMDYEDTAPKKVKEHIMSEQAKQETVGPQLPAELVTQPTVASIQVPASLDAVSHKEVLAKASDPATVAAITATVASVAVNAALTAAMKQPKVKELLQNVNEVVHKLSKGKLGKKKVEGNEKQEEQQEEGGDCKTHHLEVTASIAALRGQLEALQASVDSGSGVQLQSAYDDRFKKIEKQIKKLSTAEVEDKPIRRKR